MARRINQNWVAYNAPLNAHDKLINLFDRWQGKADSSSDNPSLIFYGIAFGLEKIADYRIYKLHSDEALNKLNDQISAIKELEGLDDLESF